MSRPKIDVADLIEDPQLLQNKAEALARWSTDTALKAILQLQSKRLPILRDNQQIKLESRKTYQMKGILIQTRGDVANVVCTKCQAHGGPCAECVMLDGHMGGGCVNCYFDRIGYGPHAACSLATKGQKTQLPIQLRSNSS